jgi:hypothetical protein
LLAFSNPFGFKKAEAPHFLMKMKKKIQSQKIILNPVAKERSVDNANS